MGNFKAFALFLLVCAGVSAQTSHPGYIVFRESTLSGAAEVVTIQQPASPSRTVVFEAASVYCSVQCDVTFERDGSPATTTAVTPEAVAANTDVATALAYRSSDAGVGTVLAKWTIGAGGTSSYNLQGMRLLKIAGRNVTIRLSNITGTARVAVKWAEAN